MTDNDDATPLNPDETGELEPVGGFEPESHQVPLHPDLEPHRGGLMTVLTQGVLGLAVLALIALGSGGTSTLEEVIGFGLIVFGVFEVVGHIRDNGPRRAYIQPSAAVIAGLILWIWPQQTIVVAGYFLAGVIALRGVLDMWGAMRRWFEEGANSWMFVRGLIEITLAALIGLFPGQSVAVVVVGGAILGVARAIFTLWFVMIHRKALSTIDPANTYAVVTYWLSRREMDAVEADEVESRVFLHRGNAKERVWRFGILMGLATTISTFGIAADSTAVVIGAMLIAPLMTPLLGTAAGLINGKTRSTAISAGIAIAGAAGAVVLSWALSFGVPDLQAVIQNAQVTARTAPSLGDLIIAIAAGAAGAYGVSRAESTDALPGVAVAIALVPPLSVIGLTLHAGDFNQAIGATLLFLTNMFSILLMAGVVFLLVGYGSWGRLYFRRNRIRVSFAAVAFAVVLISIPLALTAQSVLQRSADLRSATSAVDDWLGEDVDLRINSIDLDGDTVTVQLIGPDTPPPAGGLSENISERTGRSMTAVVRWIEEQEQISRSIG